METIEEFSTQLVNNIIKNAVNKLNAKFISLGRHCDIRSQINKFTKEPTLFFDWLRSDFKAVLKVLSYTNILDELLFHDNIITYLYNKCDMGVEFKNMILGDEKLFLLSRHDINTNTAIDKNVIQNFIDKYERRWHRIMDIINNSNKSLIFMHIITDDKISVGDEDKFIELISTINPNCNFSLVFLIHNEKSSEMIIEKRNKFLCINIEPFLKLNYAMNGDWDLQRYDWNRIFETILSNVQY